MKLCPSCAASLDDPAQACPECGASAVAAVSLGKGLPDEPPSAAPAVDLGKQATARPEPQVSLGKGSATPTPAAPVPAPPPVVPSVGPPPVPPPVRSDEDAPLPTGPGRERRKAGVLVVAAIVLLVLVGGVGGVLALTGGDTSDDPVVATPPSSSADPDGGTIGNGPTEEPAGEPLGEMDPVDDEDATTFLQDRVASDAGTVSALEGQWVAQLASNGPGESDDDFRVRYEELLDRYPDAVLLWSGDWPGSFGPSSSRNWVIVNSAFTESTTRPVIDWCAGEGWDPGKCWAKRLVTYGDDPSLNTDHAPADDRNN